MTEVKHSKLRSLIKRHYYVKHPLFIWGGTGLGKSESVKLAAEELAKELNLEYSETNIQDGRFGLVDIRLSQLDPSDLRGLPKYDNDKTKWLPPDWLPSNPESKGILFFDELNLAPPMIQASAYQLILDRKLGSYRLPPGWIVIAAGNTSEDRAHTFELPAPLKNRFDHITLLMPSGDEWIEHLVQLQDSGKKSIDSRILVHIKQNPHFLYTFKKDLKDNAFATPRSWVRCSDLICGEEDLENVYDLAATAVGDGAAQFFVDFLKVQKKFDIDKILKNPKLAAEVKELDMKYALISAISEKFRSDKKILEKILEISLHIEPEFAVFMLRMTKGIGGATFEKLVISSTIGDQVSQKYGKYLRRVNI